MFSYKRKRHLKKKTFKKKTFKKKTFKKKDIKKKNFKGGTIAGPLEVKKALDHLDINTIRIFYQEQGTDMMNGEFINEFNNRRETLANYFSNMRHNLTNIDDIYKWNIINKIIKPK